MSKLTSWSSERRARMDAREGAPAVVAERGALAPPEDGRPTLERKAPRSAGPFAYREERC
jgi:hypothetical protein